MLREVAAREAAVYSSSMPPNLEENLRHFDATEANLVKLERLWGEMKEIIAAKTKPTLAVQVRYHALTSSFRGILAAMPKLSDWALSDDLQTLDEIARQRKSARQSRRPGEIAEIEAMITAQEWSLVAYRRRFVLMRQRVTRHSVVLHMQCVDSLLAYMSRRISARRKATTSVAGADWTRLQTHITQIQVLLGSASPPPVVWSDLHRHLSFAQVCDFRDIRDTDWPEIQAELKERLYRDDEPLPVGVPDLAALAPARSSKPMAIQLKWANLSAEDFERLIFALVSQSDGYENPQWLTRPNAPDRGADLAVTRVHKDQLTGTVRHRVVIQCKHWQSRSVRPTDISQACDLMELQEPRVEVLVIATSGRFTSDATAWVEKHNGKDHRLSVEIWPNSHLELLLASRPAIVTEFGLK